MYHAKQRTEGSQGRTLLLRSHAESLSVSVTEAVWRSPHFALGMGRISLDGWDAQPASPRLGRDFRPVSTSPPIKPLPQVRRAPVPAPKRASHRAAQVAGFAYSAANKNSGIIWSDKHLEVYLQDPKKVRHPSTPPLPTSSCTLLHPAPPVSRALRPAPPQRCGAAHALSRCVAVHAGDQDGVRWPQEGGGPRGSHLLPQLAQVSAPALSAPSRGPGGSGARAVSRGE
jgi:hypothetical protein